MAENLAVGRQLDAARQHLFEHASQVAVERQHGVAVVELDSGSAGEQLQRRRPKRFAPCDAFALRRTFALRHDRRRAERRPGRCRPSRFDAARHDAVRHDAARNGDSGRLLRRRRGFGSVCDFDSVSTGRFRARRLLQPDLQLDGLGSCRGFGHVARYDQSVCHGLGSADFASSGRIHRGEPDGDQSGDALLVDAAGRHSLRLDDDRRESDLGCFRLEFSDLVQRLDRPDEHLRLRNGKHGEPIERKRGSGRRTEYSGD